MIFTVFLTETFHLSKLIVIISIDIHVMVVSELDDLLQQIADLINEFKALKTQKKII